jgi:hypothetical protein
VGKRPQAHSGAAKAVTAAVLNGESSQPSNSMLMIGPAATTEPATAPIDAGARSTAPRSTRLQTHRR